MSVLQHGVNTYKDETAAIAVQVAAVGIPFFVGAWPCHLGKGFTGKPQYCASFSDAQELGGYSGEWRDENGAPKWTLCQAAYGFHKLMNMSPAIFYNVFDPDTHKKEMSAEEFAVADHIVEMPADALKTDKLIVKAGDVVLSEGTDYEAFYTAKSLCIELLSDSASYNAAALTIAYDAVDLSLITATDIEIAIEKVELCRSVVGITPDLLCAPGWSVIPSVAAVLAAKAACINGIYRAKAVVDINTGEADEFEKVTKWKNDNGYTSEEMLACWPMTKSGDYTFDSSVIICGLMAQIDSGNGDCPYESPSNKSVPIDGLVTANGKEINLALPQADVLSANAGIVTFINNGGWTLWGNYLACYPKTSDTAKMFICTSRVQDWICNTFVSTYWPYIDQPMTAPLRDAIINSFNAWLNGLTAEGKLYGGEITFSEELNPATQLIGGMFRLDTVSASPVPAQRIDMHAHYSVAMLQAALA